MRAVTVDAAYLRVAMRGACEVRVRFRVAGQTASGNFFGGCILKDKYLRLVAAADVVRPRSMAAFAALMGGRGFRVQRRLPVGRLRPTVVDILVTRLARLGTRVLGILGRGSRSVCCAAGRARRFKVLSSSRLLSLAERQGGRAENKKERKQNEKEKSGFHPHERLPPDGQVR